MQADLFTSNRLSVTFRCGSLQQLCFIRQVISFRCRQSAQTCFIVAWPVWLMHVVKFTDCCTVRIRVVTDMYGALGSLCLSTLHLPRHRHMLAMLAELCSSAFVSLEYTGTYLLCNYSEELIAPPMICCKPIIESWSKVNKAWAWHRPFRPGFVGAQLLES